MPIIFLLMAGYLVAVMYHGNTKPFILEVGKDAESMGLYVVAWLFIFGMAAYSPPDIRPLFKTLMWLAIITYGLTNIPKIEQGFSEIKSSL